ncbi:MAG: radical SAM protein [Thermodesulfobacteriota bacterium]
MQHRHTVADVASREKGVVRKRWKGRMRIALVYPNSYDVGMSNLGFQAVYRMLNQRDDVVCERAFAPDRAKPNDGIPRTIESGRAVAEFDIIAFSISFEADYLKLLAIVHQAGLPLRSAARGDPHPLVIAGGVACFLNPEPVAPFIDCFFIGEAESLLPRFFQFHDPGLERRQLLKRLAQNVPGLYVPAFYTPRYHENGLLQAFDPDPGVPPTIQRGFQADLDRCPVCSAILTPHTSFGDTYLIEVSRGCTHGCRFCSAGFLYRPPRFRSVEQLENNIAAGSGLAGKIGLVGAAVSDHPGLERLCRFALERDLSISFSSLRADALTPSLAEVLRRSHVKTATIAPDAGSERMRRVINKGISEKQILEAVRLLVSGGIPNVKLYFMIGLPFETEADIEAIVALCRNVKDRFLEASRRMGRIGGITVAINPFVPKPFTPFQWAAMDDPKSLRMKSEAIRKGLAKIDNLTVQLESVRQAYTQALFARGDRRLADLLERAVTTGGNWTSILKSWTMEPDFYVLRERALDELLPWDFIDHGIRKSFLWKEFRWAADGKTSAPCPVSNCTRCGVCGQAACPDRSGEKP